ncbi:MAG: hypothetical protein M1818_000464 [Claussenomyces sp. TS43310]|nr:MAG: hypothetical protein M1818_000464 [Claussenomyces sp. TS43310]
MSRGGRGGGGAGRNAFRQMGWEDDATAKLDSKPSELFPSYQIPVAAPLTETEKRDIGFYKEFRDEVHRGPLYTKLRKRDPNESKKNYGEEQENARFAAKSKADFDPFNDGVPTFSKKYEQKPHQLPLFAGEFDKRFFPQELWSALEGEDGAIVRGMINMGIKKQNRYQNMTPAERKARLDALEERLRREEADGDNDTVRDEDDVAEEEEDVDYENDEAEMGGDYDAEQYFDGGEDDEEHDEGGGGGGDDY